MFALIGTTYGSGDGDTTFNLPDKSGRISAMKEAVADGSRLLNTTYFGDSTMLGFKGGLQSHTLATAEISSHTHDNSISDPGHTHGVSLLNGGGSVLYNGGGALTFTGGSFALTIVNNLFSINNVATGITVNNVAAGGGSQPHKNVQPTIIVTIS